MRARITITLPPHLAERLARELADRPSLTRSALVAEIVTRHYMEAHWAAHEAATVAYYSGRTAEERVEDEGIARAGAASLSRILAREDRPRRRRKPRAR